MGQVYCVFITFCYRETIDNITVKLWSNISRLNLPFLVTIIPILFIIATAVLVGTLLLLFMLLRFSTISVL